MIGAGIVGASVAFRLSQGGARVWIVDKAEPASGTTSASFAWVNANNKTPREYFDLNRAGMEEHLRLRDELPGSPPWLHREGNLILAEDEDLGDLESRVERLRSWGYAAEWWKASRVVAEMEPHVVFPNPDTPVAFFPDEGWVDATQLTKILIERARQYGAELRFGTALESIRREEDGSVSGLRLSGGDVTPVDAVVNAAGPDTDLVAGMVGRELPLQSKNGLLVRVATKAGILGRLLHTPHVNLRPEGTRHVLLNHGSVDETLVAGDEERMSEKLLGHARKVIPSMAKAEIKDVRVGRRPIPEDGVSCVGAVSSMPGYYEAVTHSGVTLGPLIGRLLAREILAGEVDPLLAPFRSDRFGARSTVQGD